MNCSISNKCCGVVVLMVTGLMAGCATERSARFGIVSEGDLKPGESVPDFSFIGDGGEVDTFGHVRGVVTIVAFPDDPAWPDCERCREIVQLASRLTRLDTPVTVVSIATPAKGCENATAAFHRCDIKGHAQLVSLCDHRARVREMYGPDALGKFYVIDSYGQIAATGRLSEMKNLEQAVRAVVEPHQEYMRQMQTP